MSMSSEIPLGVIAVIMWGLVIGAQSLVEPNKTLQPESYWLWSLVALAVGFTLFSMVSSASLVLTLANTSFVMGYVYVGLFARSLSRPLSTKTNFYPLAAILVYGLVFEYLRQRDVVIGREVMMLLACSSLLVWRLAELWRADTQGSTALKFLVVASSAELLSAVTRLVLLYVEVRAPGTNAFYQEPFWSALNPSVWFACQVLSAIAMIAFFIEKRSVTELKLVQDAQRANMTKGQFLSSAAHEIRTPLHGLIGLLSMAIRSSPPAEIKKSLDQAYYSSKTLLLILNDILNFSKIEAGVIDIRKTPFEIQTMFHETKALFSIPAIEKDIQLRFDLDPDVPKIVVCDSHKLRQILFNLIGNAIKYTDQGSVEIKTRLERLDSQWGALQISVIDTGIGISAEDLPFVLEPFRQVDNAHRDRYDGIGLGLSISQSLLLMMDTKLVMHSKPNKGTVASFSLRIALDPNVQSMPLVKDTPPTMTNQSVRQSLAGRCILVVEDNPVNMEVVRQYSKHLRVKPTFAQDGVQCLNALKANTYDLLLMDIRMPNLGGNETTKKIRQMNHLQKLPIVGVSASSTPHDLEASLGSGMNDFLFKPFNVEEFEAILLKNIAPSLAT
jgi:signal transduction histidine kinase/ActR/RegA family two-component response regulator